VDAHFLLAGTYMVKKDYAGAERCYRSAIALKPSHGEAHHWLGDCRLKQGDKAGALQEFRAAVRYRPDLAIAQLDLGALLLEEGQVEEAIARLSHAVSLDGRMSGRASFWKRRGQESPDEPRESPCP